MNKDGFVYSSLPQTRFFYVYQKDIIKHPPETMV